MTPTNLPDDRPIVLFDGVCNLCNAAVNFIIDRDPDGRICFAPLQSDVGREFLKRAKLPTETVDTMVLIEGDSAFVRSSAAFRIARWLKWPWPVMFVFIVIPRFARDGVYRFVARNRYRWFGRSDACRIPTPEIQERFLA